jgi:hypothetical protein
VVDSSPFTSRVAAVWRILGWLTFGLAMTVLLLAAAAGDLILLFATAANLILDFGAFLGLTYFIFAVPVTFGLAVLIHELGHVVGGRWVGMVPFQVIVGPVTFRRVGNRWRAGWVRHQPWLGGRAICRNRPADRWRMALFLASGPAANFAAGLAAGFAAVLTVPSPVRAGLGLFAVHSLFFGAMNLLPFRERRLDSDGLALFGLLSGKK